MKLLRLSENNRGHIIQDQSLQIVVFHGLLQKRRRLQLQRNNGISLIPVQKIQTDDGFIPHEIVIDKCLFPQHSHSSEQRVFPCSGGLLRAGNRPAIPARNKVTIRNQVPDGPKRGRLGCPEFLGQFARRGKLHRHTAMGGNLVDNI